MKDNQHFFSGMLNYSACNEDGRSELALMDIDAKARILVVSGGGERLLNLLINPLPRDCTLTALDANVSQLHLFELKRSAIVGLDRDTFLGFVGIAPMSTQHRVTIFRDVVQCRLSQKALQFWEQNLLSIGRGVIYLGKFERFALLMSKVCRLFLGPHIHLLFECDTPEAQARVVNQHFHGLRWELLTRTLCRKLWFRLFTSDPAFYAHVDIPSYYEHLRGRIDSALARIPARENFLLSLMLLGRYCHEHDVVPPCYSSRFYAVVRDNLARCTTHTVHDFLTVHLESDGKPYRFMSLSDVPSYLQGNDMPRFARAIAGGLSPDGLAVVRELFTRHAGLSGDRFSEYGLKTDESIANAAEQTDSSFIYRFHIFQRN